MNYDQEKAVSELTNAIDLIKMGMVASAKECIRHSLTSLDKSKSPPACTAPKTALNSNPNKR